jgi:hypothetical protein
MAVVVLSAVIVMRQPIGSDPFAASEQARVRAHFDSAERELRGKPVTGLSVAQHAARAQALDRLHAYAARGVFPKNRDFPGRFVPYFVDRVTGTRCGMAYLIEEAGSGAFVARIAQTNNNAVIPDLKNDPDMIAWLEQNGLTLEEAARIQPKYECPRGPGCTPYVPNPPPSNTAYEIATGMSVGVDVLTVVLNAAHPHMSRSLTGGLGLAAGMVGLVLGAPNIDVTGQKRTLAFVNIGAGAVSAAFGVYRLARMPTDLGFAPWVSSTGAPGLSGRITF